jgi:hypothetical protein
MLMRRNLLTILLLALPLPLSWQAQAQEPQKFRVVIADNVNRLVGKSVNGEVIDITGAATEALIREYSSTVNAKRGPRFEVIGKQEVAASAERLGIKTLTAEGYPRIAEELKADLLVQSVSAAVLTLQKREAHAGVTITVLDVFLKEPVGLGIARETAGKMQQAVERVMKKAVRQSWERLRLTTNVRKVVGDVVVLDRGLKGGIHAGDKFVITRDVEGRRVKLGAVRVARAFARDVEAEIIEGKDILTGDTAIRVAEFRTGCTFGLFDR